MFGKSKKLEQLVDRLSRCTSCGHSNAAGGCTCRRSDCACGTAHNR